MKYIIAWLVVWLVGQSVVWLFGWLVGRLVGWLVGRSVGWLVGCDVAQWAEYIKTIQRSTSKGWSSPLAKGLAMGYHHPLDLDGSMADGELLQVRWIQCYGRTFCAQCISVCKSPSSSHSKGIGSDLISQSLSCIKSTTRSCLWLVYSAPLMYTTFEQH